MEKVVMEITNYMNKTNELLKALDLVRTLGGRECSEVEERLVEKSYILVKEYILYSKISKRQCKHLKLITGSEKDNFSFSCIVCGHKF